MEGVVSVVRFLLDTSLARYYFESSIPPSPQDHIIYQLHGFSDASKCAYGSVVYLRRLVNRIATVAIVWGKSKVVLRHQESWPIARKELVAAVTTAELSKKAFVVLGFSDCKQYFWSDSNNALHWIKNKDLRLDLFRAALKKFVYCRNRRIGDIVLRT